MMSYEQALAYLHHTSWKGSRLGLARTRQLLGRMGDPQKNLRFIHIAGTNGKGSTAAMLAGILQQAGYVTGLYTSPYLHRFNERMQVDGMPISDQELAELTEEIQPLAEAMDDHPTEFELVTCIGFAFFRRRNCDIVVLEVGMGGRLDSTNVIGPPEAAVITAIGLDHTEMLGDTVEKIAAEKAGIIKQGCDTVLCRQLASVEQTVREVCRAQHSPLYITRPQDLVSHGMTIDGQSFDCPGMQGLSLPLLGEHQLHNAAAVLATVEILRGRGWRIDDAAVRNGLARTRWPARFEVLRRSPVFVVDGGHNPQGALTVANTLTVLFPGKKILFLTGVLADKDYCGILEPVLSLAREFVVVTPDNPRALPAGQLAEILTGRYGCDATVCDTVEQGVERVLALSGPEDVICSFGSLYMAGAVRQALLPR